RSGGGEAGGDIEVDQAVVTLGDGGGVLPAHAEVEGQARAGAPVVGEEQVVGALAEVLVGVAEGEALGVGGAEQEILEVVAAGGAVEGEAAARVGLLQEVELEPAQVAAKGQVVIVMVPVSGVGEGSGLVAVVGR